MQDGVRGYNTDAARGADTFVPFKSGDMDYIYPGFPNETLTINYNTKDTLYLISVAYAGGGGSLSRTPITNCTGADYELLVQYENTSSKYAFSMYKLTNAEDTVTIETKASSYGGNMIVFG